MTKRFIIEFSLLSFSVRWMMARYTGEDILWTARTLLEVTQMTNVCILKSH